MLSPEPWGVLAYFEGIMTVTSTLFLVWLLIFGNQYKIIKRKQ